MADEITKHGLFYDDLYALRVLEPEVATETQDLVDECGGYADSECGIEFVIQTYNICSSPRTGGVPAHLRDVRRHHRCAVAESRTAENAHHRRANGTEVNDQAASQSAAGIAGNPSARFLLVVPECGGLLLVYPVCPEQDHGEDIGVRAFENRTTVFATRGDRTEGGVGQSVSGIIKYIESRTLPTTSVYCIR